VTLLLIVRRIQALKFGVGFGLQASDFEAFSSRNDEAYSALPNPKPGA